MEATYEPLLDSPPQLRVRVPAAQHHAEHLHSEPAKSHSARESESVDYLPADSQVYRQWLATQRPWKGDRWLMLAVVGISDFLRTVETARLDPAWAGPTISTTGYIFAAAFYWIFCFGMSRYSLMMERRLSAGRKR